MTLLSCVKTCVGICCMHYREQHEFPFSVDSLRDNRLCLL